MPVIIKHEIRYNVSNEGNISILQLSGRIPRFYFYMVEMFSCKIATVKIL